jgi:hypothetical protein
MALSNEQELRQGQEETMNRPLTKEELETAQVWAIIGLTHQSKYAILRLCLGQNLSTMWLA